MVGFGMRGGGTLNDGSAVGSVSLETDGTARWSKGEGKSMSRTGGKETLPLSFHRAYFFVAPMTLDVSTVEQADGKLRLRSVRPESDTLGPRTLMYLLPEPKALAAYGRGEVPIDVEQVRDAVKRWSDGDWWAEGRSHHLGAGPAGTRGHRH